MNERREMTRGETEMLREVFGPCIPYSRVRIVPHRWFAPLPIDRPMAPNGNVYMPGRTYAADYSAASVPLALKATFVHEGAHLYQWYCLGWIVWARGPFDRDYTYRLEPGKRFADYRLEQMGMIAEHYFILKRGGRPGDLPDRGYMLGDYTAVLPVR